MRIALLHPTYWPEVRRGSERLIHDIGSVLARRGHEVTLLTTHPRPSARSREDGIEVVRSRRPPDLPRVRDHEYFAATAPIAAARLLAGRYDVAHAFFNVDAWAAVRARALGGPPVVFSFHGTPVRRYLVTRKRRLALMSAAAQGADAVTVLSEAAAVPYRRYLLRDPVVLPGGVFCADFAVEAPRAEAPTLICAASLGDPRKRGRLLLDAFTRVRERVPEARLLLAGGRDPFLSRVRLELPAGVETVEGDDVEALARGYASAWASVLPAVAEAFGLVLIESLAAGTPCIAADSGACPEVLTRPETGTLVAPDDPAALAEAMTAALRRPPDAAAADACRARAADFEWERIADRYEDLYATLRPARVG